MVHGMEHVGENRYRETFGRWFEDFSEGDVYEHRPARTITQFDVVLYTLLTMSNDPLHFNAEYGKQTEFGQCLVPSSLTLGILVGMSISDVSYKGVANLGYDEVRATAPVVAGDTLYAESEVLVARESNSRPDNGVVTVRTRGYTQTGEQVMKFERSILVPKRGAGTPEEPFPTENDDSSLDG